MTPAAISHPSAAGQPGLAGSADGRIECEVLVLGGGSTGVGVARDAAMRGFSTVLVERGDLATGTTGRFHGLLHSGGRYAVKDPQAARECIAENIVLRRIAADCIEDTGGLFVTTPIDDPDYADRFIKGCQDTGVPVEEIPVAEALRREPRLNRRITRASGRAGRDGRCLEDGVDLRQVRDRVRRQDPAVPRGHRRDQGR